MSEKLTLNQKYNIQNLVIYCNLQKSLHELVSHSKRNNSDILASLNSYIQEGHCITILSSWTKNHISVIKMKIDKEIEAKLINVNNYVKKL